MERRTTARCAFAMSLLLALPSAAQVAGDYWPTSDGNQWTYEIDGAEQSLRVGRRSGGWSHHAGSVPGLAGQWLFVSSRTGRIYAWNARTGSYDVQFDLSGDAGSTFTSADGTVWTVEEKGATRATPVGTFADAIVLSNGSSTGLRRVVLARSAGIVEYETEDGVARLVEAEVDGKSYQLGGPRLVNARRRGQTEFSTFEPVQRYFYPLARASMESGADAKSAAPSGREGQVEEADIYKIVGDRLYLLNTYRGLMIFDIADPGAPRLISRAPVFGYPVEMFVDGNVVYALFRDVLYLSTDESGLLRFERHNVSQIASIDVGDVREPKVLERIDIIGHIKEGVSRKIDDTIYVVSHVPQSYYWGWGPQPTDQQKEQAWVYSFDVADPEKMRKVDELQVFEGGGGDGRNFSNLAISATSNALMVAENWYDYRTSPGFQEAIVSIIDVSDPRGTIRTHTRLTLEGQLTDQFKQSYFVEAGRAIYLAILTRRVTSAGQTRNENVLEAWDVSDGDRPEPCGSLLFGKPDETVRGSIFDLDRKVAYAITARRIDPLYALSFADPKKLAIRSEVDGLSGDMSVFRLVGGGKFLLGIGRDNSAGCSAFGTGGENTIAATVIDVADLDAIQLVQRECIRVEDASWIGSDISWNLDQAHKLIGTYDDGQVALISLPVHYSRKVSGSAGGWWYHHETAVGLMRYDLSRYVPGASHTRQKVLENLGTVIHPEGNVRRSILFDHPTRGGRKMINLSDTHLSVTDLGDLYRPKTEAVVELAPFQSQIFRFGRHLVEHLQPGWSNYDGESRFRVKVAGPGLEDATPVAEFAAGRIEKAVAVGDNLVLFRRVDPQAGSPAQETEVVVYDLSDPARPVEAGTARLPVASVPYHRFFCGVMPYWYDYGSGNRMIVTSDGLVLFQESYDYTSGATTRELVYLDLSKPTRPKVTRESLAFEKDETFRGLVGDPLDADRFYMSLRKGTGKTETHFGQEFHESVDTAQTWFAGPSGLKPRWSPISIPGTLLSVSTNGRYRTFLTSDKAYRYDVGRQAYQEVTRLNFLALVSGPKAWLADTEWYEGKRLSDVVLDGTTLVVNARQGSPYWGGPIYYKGPTTIEPDEFRIYDLGRWSFDKRFEEEIGTRNLSIMGSVSGWLFLNLSGDGVLSLDIRDPRRPRYGDFVRTLGYASQVTVAGERAYVPAGNYGVYELDLRAGRN